MASSVAMVGVAKQPQALCTGQRRGLIEGKAGERVSVGMKKKKEENSNGRRDLVFAAAAAAAAAVSFGRAAMADEEPKKGTPEAKKKYAPICVTMPTARICHK